MLSGSGSMHFASSATVSWVMQWYILITHHSKFIKHNSLNKIHCLRIRKCMSTVQNFMIFAIM